MIYGVVECANEPIEGQSNVERSTFLLYGRIGSRRLLPGQRVKRRPGFGRVCHLWACEDRRVSVGGAGFSKGWPLEHVIWETRRRLRIHIYRASRRVVFSGKPVQPAVAF